MKTPDYASRLIDSARRLCRRAHPQLLTAIATAGLLLQPHSAVAALSFARGTPTAVGSVQFSSSPDSVTITGAYTDPSIIDTTLNIPANRIQYDVINSDQGTMFSWTLNYAATVGPDIIGAATPLGFVNQAGVATTQGGAAYMTLFNAGYGIYNYNPGSPWTIDYEATHITFTASAAAVPVGLPANDGVGGLNPTFYLPSFAVLYKPNLANGLVPASAVISTAKLTGQVYGPLPGNPCLTIESTNITVTTCSSCVPVNFSVNTIDACCSNVTVRYSPPSGTCFPINSTNSVTVTASDSCGNFASNNFTVTLVEGNCPGTPCITLDVSNIVAYTCSNCAEVYYNVTAVDNCCPAAGPTLVFDPPPGTCFPVSNTIPVEVTATDACTGQSVSNVFTVTVLPGNCNSNPPCIQIQSPNVVAYTCSNCTTVPYPVRVVDDCCSNWVVYYSPPTNTCFPIDSTNRVKVIVYDQCGNTATNSFLVVVLRGATCGGSTGLLTITNIVGLPGTGYFGTNAVLNWPPVNVYLQQSGDLVHWSNSPGGTNAPYIVPNPPPSQYYRLQFYNPTN